ncbi:nucleotidyltransferase domain-containing protein [Saccharopolyspora oryzae]|uniref:Nucleotidyltransferase domain-containing protein n=1 Tax=Saccharopolyspora oryzae TaxID=2997343 RepID=A0ABT4VB19_9PSEU|nr:nucleotidyltransferase domain-containing protein [Saccharopolyspora oryzae]MDA3631161.1 nucleotidyltransferase domain-containing protein [Saccharopolyspora oryzae]
MTSVVDAPHRRITLDEVRAHRDEIYRIAEQYGISNIRVFGSVARGEADDDSDLDLLIDVARGSSLWDMSGFALDVEELLNVFTQVATPNGLKERIRDNVLAEAVPI